MELLDPIVVHDYKLSIHACTERDFEYVKMQIRNMELDNRDLKVEEFLVMKSEEDVVGFGRIREFNGFSELCSMGILEHVRSKGLGAAMVRALCKKATQSLYLACIIPDYFSQLGFNVCNTYPELMQDKLDYCTESLPVPEPYVVMCSELLSNTLL